MTDQTRERIIAAAGPIFARDGLDGTTIREICRVAEVNLASVNYHFGCKDSLYVETVRAAYEQRLQEVPVPEFHAGIPPERQLELFIRALAERMLGEDDAGWQARLLMREAIEPTQACTSIVEEFIRPQETLLLSILDKMLPAETPQLRRHQIAFSIIGQCLHYRMAKRFVSLLVSEECFEQLYQLDELAAHVTRFSLAAIQHYYDQAAKTGQPVGADSPACE